MTTQTNKAFNEIFGTKDIYKPISNKLIKDAFGYKKDKEFMAALKNK